MERLRGGLGGAEPVSMNIGTVTLSSGVLSVGLDIGADRVFARRLVKATHGAGQRCQPRSTAYGGFLIVDLIL